MRKAPAMTAMPPMAHIGPPPVRRGASVESTGTAGFAVTITSSFLAAGFASTLAAAGRAG